LADYVTIALSPVLIMALVGSLVFFLLEVLYAGQYAGQLQWTLFFFVFAMVLVARISIEMGSERAGMYGLGMVLAGFLALQLYLKFPEDSPLAMFGWAINLGLMLLIWWCANKLTWDCTAIDDNVDASGQGLLEAAGLDQVAPAKPEEELESEEPEKPPIRSTGLVGWWERYERYRDEQRKKPHTPGVWVVYFSLAALPLFGLGQALIPAEDGERRRYVFWLMACYVASGLSLLVTTAYLGLRRYLRQRKLRMPVAMTGIWLALGGGMIVVLMIVGALMPRPNAEYSLFKFTPLGSKERNASQYAMRSEGSGKGQGSTSADKPKDDQEAQQGAGTKRDPKAQGTTQGKSGSGAKSGKSKTGGKSSGNKGGNSRSQSRQKDDSGKNQDEKKDDEKRDQEDEQKDDEKDKDTEKSGSPSRFEPSKTTSTRTSNNSVSKVVSSLGKVGPVLKWILIIAGVLAIGFFLLRSGLRFLANFTTWAQRLLDALRSWWESLFGSAKKESESSREEQEESEPVVRLQPFASYPNPFHDGRAEEMSPNDLIRYSFEALQAWAYERDLERHPKETPLEFAARLVEEVPGLEAEAQRLAGLYARVAYARARFGDASKGPIKQFWERLQAVAERPLSV
jgi:hypothetical protein